jgi:putative ABC transport system permease protein
VRFDDEWAPEARPSSVVARLATTGAPPTAVIGVRRALERGHGATSIPVGTALFGTALAVTALCATAVFGASLSHLTATPALYGSDYQLTFSNTGGAAGNFNSELAGLKHDPAITGIMLAARDEVSINGVSVLAIAGEAVRGPLLFSVVSGRLPTGDGDVALGSTTLEQVHGHVGSLVRVTVQRPNGGTRTASFRVVGTASFPSDAGLGGLGTGAAFTLSGLLHVVCPPGRTQSECQSAASGNQSPAVLARVVSGPKGQADIARYASEAGATRPTIPTSLVNFGEAVNFPLILGFVLAVFGAATLLHLLVVSVIRRRREMGLLKALGFVSRQLGTTVLWQATTVALVGIVFGVPLGIVFGRLIWKAFATNLGAVPVPTVPAGAIVGMALGVLVIANLLAVVPAMISARRLSVGRLLRTP